MYCWNSSEVMKNSSQLARHKELTNTIKLASDITAKHSIDPPSTATHIVQQLLMIDTPSKHLIKCSKSIDPPPTTNHIAEQQMRMINPPPPSQNSASGNKRVRFSRKNEVLPHSFNRNENLRLWYTRKDIEAFITQRRKEINHVQNMSKSIADTIDASEYMVSGSLRWHKNCKLVYDHQLHVNITLQGLELCLSRRLGESLHSLVAHRLGYDLQYLGSFLKRLNLSSIESTSYGLSLMSKRNARVLKNFQCLLGASREIQFSDLALLESSTRPAPLMNTFLKQA